MPSFPFAFDPRWRRPLKIIGVTETTASVEVDDDSFLVHFGVIKLKTKLANVHQIHVTGDYKWYRAIGPHMSFADRGASFGTNVERGVCVTFHEPVPALLPRNLVRHPGVTVTVADVDGLVQLLRSSITPR